MTMNFFKTFMAVIFTLTLIPVAAVHADSGLLDVLDYEVDYDIENGELLDIDLDVDFTTLVVEIVSFDDGFIELTLPRGLIDSKYSQTEDDIFYVIIDGAESDYLEVDFSDSYRTLLIPFFVDDQQIEIFGTEVVASDPIIVETSGTMEEEMVEEETMKEEETVQEEIMKEEEMMEEKTMQEEGGGCLIATAAFGSELAPQVQFLREVRDNTLLSTTSGVTFMTGFNHIYYSFSPIVADMERENPVFKEAVKLFITPMLSILSIMTLAENGNDLQVLGLGISVIALNLGMYFVAPVAVIHKIRKSSFL